MNTAVCEVPVHDRSDWLDELGLILDRWGGLSRTAQDRVTAVVESFLDDPKTTAADASTARQLLGRIDADTAWNVAYGRRPALALT